jgi:Flp pilus assembly protein TadG
MPILANTSLSRGNPEPRRGASLPLGHRLCALGKDEHAAATVEFSLVALPLLGLILAALQLSMIFFAGQMLQSAATNAGRELMTGQAQSSGMTAAQFETLVCNRAAGFFNCNNLMVDVESAGSFSAVNTAPPTITYDSDGKPTNVWSWSPGIAGQVVIVKVMYNWPVFGPSALGLSNQSNGSHLLVAVTVFKDELFPS